MKKHCVVLVFAVALLTLSSVALPARDNGHFQAVASASYPCVGWNERGTADISAGWRFNRGNYLGVGSGMHLVRHWYGMSHGPAQVTPRLKAIPLYADYIHYFRFGRSLHSFYLGQELGASYYLDVHPEIHVERFGRIRPYTNTKLGVDFGFNERMGVMLGINLITVPMRWEEYFISPCLGFRF